MFTEVLTNKIFQAKKACEIGYRTDNKGDKTVITAQKITYGTFPSVLNLTINYKGVSYVFSCASSDFAAKANSYLQLMLGYIIVVSSNYITFIKRYRLDEDFTITTTDNCTLSSLTGTNSGVENIVFPVHLIIRDSVPTTLAELKKSVADNGIAMFDINSIIRSNIAQEYNVRQAFSIAPTSLLKAFTIYGETLSGTDSFNQVSIFGINTNLNVSELDYLVSGKPLMVNNCIRYIDDDSNEKIFFYKGSSTAAQTVKITAYDYLRRNSEVYTLNVLPALANNTIHEMQVNWNCIKRLFSSIADDDICEYVVSMITSNVVDWSVNYIRKQFKQKKEFVYINKFSAWDNIIFDANNETHLNIEQETVESKSTIVLTSKKAYEKQVQNSGFITSEERREHLKDFFLSEKIYEVIEGSLVECIVTADDYLMKQIDRTELNNIQFEYSYSNVRRIK